MQQLLVQTTGAPRIALTATRLAAQLAKEPRARYMLADEIAQDAIRVAVAACRARSRLLRQADATPLLNRCVEILERYDASPVLNRDVEGMVIGARFVSGTHRSGFSDVFHIC